MAKQQLVGYVETDSGSILITDGVWKDNIPNVFQKTLYMEDAVIDEKKNVLPIYMIQKEGKRFLLIALDDGTPATDRVLEVETENPVILPEEGPPEPPSEEEESEDAE